MPNQVRWGLRSRAILLSFCLAASLSSSAIGQAGKFEVSAASPAVLFVDGAGKTDGSIEASGVASLGDGTRVLVAHDRVSGLICVDRATGRILGEPVGCAAFPDSSDAKKRPKWEALAQDDEGFYYVIGSHSGTPEEKVARAYLFRFKVEGDGSEAHPAKIVESSVRRWHVDASIVALLQAEGLDSTALDKRKIEGLAVRSRRGANGRLIERQLVIGLREPDDLVRAFSGDITELPADGAALPLARLFSFAAGAREGVNFQLCSLEYVTNLKSPGYLVLTSTEDEQNGFHGNALWHVPEGRLDAPRLIWEFEPSMKVEGLAALPGAAGRFVIVYDNDPNKTQIPSRIQTITIAE